MDYKETLNLPQTTFPMKANLSQKEPEMLKKWTEMDMYGRLRSHFKGKPRFILHDGPPYANGHIHLGHTINKVLKDIIIKSRQLQGFDAPYVPGWDCHGLPIEHNVEKDLGSKKKDMSKLEIRKACRRYAEKFVDIQREEFKRLGVFGDWERPYLTMSYDYEAAICREFCDIFLKGYVVKSKKPVYWCPTCITALAEAEVEYADHKSPSITVKFAAKEDLRAWCTNRLEVDSPVFVLIWTTTPWTLPANLAVALHPDFDYVAVKVENEIWIVAEGRLSATLLSAGKEPMDAQVLGRFIGREIEGMHLLHPFIQRESLLVTADYVTLDTGTGCVHTAPGHGADDYSTGLRYALDIYAPVDDRGRFTQEVADFAGINIFDANAKIIELLQEKGALVASESLVHSYPHCWRCKRPVIFRATSQWFISMDGQQALRKKALSAIEKVQWIPEWGKDRIRGMVEARPDWCVSRQRAWGVPVTVFVCEDCGTPFMDAATAQRLHNVFSEEGADAWFARDVGELLPPHACCSKCGGKNIKKETDILDVWFDSGVSHAVVLGQRSELSWPADLYLEGSDQHRGWFQSSLLTSVATRDRAPYRAVLTHGFVVDGQGKKMSKSVGNVISPADIIKEHGAEILRLWVASEDYQDDIKISKEILQRMVESYRKIRNTFRYLLSNLYDFNPDTDTVSETEFDVLDKWALSRLNLLKQRVIMAYNNYKFHQIYHRVHEFCTVDMSALYLDIIKDRLYCELKSGIKRRSAQTVLYRIARDLLIMVSPILSFTAEEAWAHLNKGTVEPAESIFLAELGNDKGAFKLSDAESRKWDEIWRVRFEITKALELARKEKRIGLALDARVVVSPPDELTQVLQENVSLLQTLSIVSQLEIGAPEEGTLLVWEAQDVPGLKVSVFKANGQKCARCWTWSETVGADSRFTDVCERCAGVLKAMNSDALA
ncbi:MAG: isoleucine--tRNA ligase [Dissulfuribacterales bacterium]